MPIRDTIQIGDPRLKAPNKAIERLTDRLVKQAIQDLIDTMRANELIGIAAPQIGENWKMFVTEPRETKTRTAGKLSQYLFPILSKEYWIQLKESVPVTVGIGELMQWEADKDLRLVAYEVCFPPYKDGRFESLK